MAPLKDREIIIFGHEVDWEDHLGRTAHFKGIHIDKLKELLKKKLINPDLTQNGSPTIEAFMDFMEKHPDVLAHGYVIVPSRDDHRVSLEGVEYKGEATKELIYAFAEAFRYADEFEISKNGLHCWWD